jgi:GntR family transcriptional regulator
MIKTRDSEQTEQRGEVLASGRRVTQVSSGPSIVSLLKLSHETAMPIYMQLEQQLENLIQEGILPTGTTLPAERQLAESLGVSRTTVQRSYDMLRQQKLVSANGRLGYIVQERGRVHTGMDRLKGFTEEMRELGRVPSTDLLNRSLVYDRSVASIFGVPSTVRFLKLERVRRGDGIPLSHEKAWFNLEAAPDLGDFDGTGSVYAFLNERCDLPLTYCDQSIEATHPTVEECGIFGFQAPMPCLLIKRRTHARGNIMVEYVEGLFRGDMYTYRLRLAA